MTISERDEMTNRAKKNDAADTAASGEVGTETAEPTATPATPNEQQSGRNRRSQRLTAFTSVERLLLRLESEWSVVRFDEDGQYEMLPSGGADVIDQLTQVRDVLRLMLLEPISEMRAVIDACRCDLRLRESPARRGTRTK